jgi:hypothetical protein
MAILFKGLVILIQAGVSPHRVVCHRLGNPGSYHDDTVAAENQILVGNHSHREVPIICTASNETTILTTSHEKMPAACRQQRRYSNAVVVLMDENGSRMAKNQSESVLIPERRIDARSLSGFTPLGFRRGNGVNKLVKLFLPFYALSVWCEKSAIVGKLGHAFNKLNITCGGPSSLGGLQSQRIDRV